MTGAHTVRAGDAHAWVEIHFQQNGWVAFDPTPRPDAAMGFTTGRHPVYFGLESFTGVTFASLLSPISGKFSISPLSLPGWVWATLPGIGIAAVFLTLLLRRRKTRIKQDVRSYSALDGESRMMMLSLYGKMAKMLVKKGLPSREPYQPPGEYAAFIYPEIPECSETVDWLSKAANSAAYNPRAFSPSTAWEARQKLSTLKRELRGRLRK